MRLLCRAVGAGVSLSKPKGNSLRSRWTGISTKAKRVIAAVAVAAVLLTVVTIVLFRSSTGERPPSQQETVVTNNSPELPAVGADARQPSRVSENPTQSATDGMTAAGADARRSSSVIENPKQAATGGMTAVGAAARQSRLVIENPKHGATVGMREDLTGRIEGAGWPVIFVQADIPGQPWWCQAPVAKVEGGKFTSKVVFGEESTPSGTRFRIAGIIAGTREQALNFNIGSKEQALPKGFPQSAEVVVTHR